MNQRSKLDGKKVKEGPSGAKVFNMQGAFYLLLHPSKADAESISVENSPLEL